VPLGFQVWAAAGVLLALLTAVSLLALVLVNGIKGDEARLNGQDVPYASAVAEAALNAKGAANDQRGFLLTGDGGFITEADDRIDRARVAFDAAGAAAISTDQRHAVDEARAGFERWVRVVQQETATYRAGNHAGPVQASLGADRQLRKAYEQWLTSAQALGSRSIESSDSSLSAALSHSTRTLLAGLIIALAVGLGVAFWLVRSIAMPVYRLVALLTPAEPSSGLS
jgi:methyl-accepting chemotaxis protein